MLNIMASPAAVAELHERTLHLLQTTGVSFETPEAQDLFRRHGFDVQGSWVTFKPAEVEQALATIPSSFTIRGLAAGADFGAGALNIASASGALEICEQGVMRPATRDDFIRRQQLDALSPLVNIGNMDLLHVPELAHEKELIHKAALALSYNPKPLIGSCATEESARQTLRLARDFYQGASEYYLLGIGNMVSPLRYTAENIGAMNVYAEYGQPLVLTCCSIPGLTSPITLSGTLVQNNAEILAGLVYMQLLKPGLPLVYGNSTFGVDMRSADTSAGAFEAALLIPYTAALARFYHLPSRVTGSLNDAKLPDYQAGMETTVGFVYALAAQVDFIFHACGGLDALMLFSFEKYLLDEELLLRLLHAGQRDMLYGLDISLDDLATAREGVNFITSRQTYREFKTQHFNPQLSSRERARSWRQNGSPTVEQKAACLLEQRLAQYEPPALDSAQQEILKIALENN